MSTESSLLCESWDILHWLNGILVTESVVWPLQFSQNLYIISALISTSNHRA